MNRLLFVLVLGTVPSAHAQVPDSLRAQQLQAVVVTADRAPGPVATSTNAVTVLDARALRRQPVRTLAEAIQQAPGLSFVDFDGLGFDPQAMVRGFYGGGEAEYFLLLLDGRPLNSLESGRIVWDLIPLSAVERIEIVRGGASAAWGDAALGGVINVITHDAEWRGAKWDLALGGFATWRANLAGRTWLASRDLIVFGAGDRTDGFRQHAWRATGRGGGSITLLQGERGRLNLSTLGQWRDFDVPGPLLDRDLADDRAGSDVFFRFDRTADRSYRFGLDGALELTGGSRVSGSLAGEHRTTQAVRTLPLSTESADTQDRDLRTTRALATVQLDLPDTPLPLVDRFTIGLDASYGTLRSEYYKVITGPRAAYQSADGRRGELDASGAGERAASALFAQYTLMPAAALRISVGARQDWLRDRYEPRADGAAERLHATHSAFSPKVGLNLAYLDGDAHNGSVYVSVGRSFKAPTLDQLFDQRRIPVAADFSITTSNPLLEPQHGTNVEAGLYQGAEFLSGRLIAELSISAYQIDMKDELDFDLQTFRYVNIGESRHRGLEAGMKLGVASATAFLNYTLQNVTAESGENRGKYLKAIPRHVLSVGANITPYRALAAGLVVSHASDIYLDDANTLTLPPFTRVDVRLAHAVGPLDLFLDVRNLFAREYSTTGFPDPSGSNAIYYYPAAGRVLEIGVRSRR